MNCEQCGTGLDVSTKFCPACGKPASSFAGPALAGGAAPAVALERKTKLCPFCSEEILESAIRCRFCGGDLVAGPGAMNIQRRSDSGIALNAPTIPAQGAAPSIVIQNVQAQQPVQHAFIPGQYKNPGVALFLSFIFPGGGQFYNGHVGKGLLVLFTFWTGIMWVWSLFDAYSSAQRINRIGF